MASTLATPIAQAVISLFDGNLGKLLNYGYRPGYGILGATLIDWTPADLFLLGEQGAWYDPSDLTTMFQDAAGTTPVTAVEQPVGLILDKSKGLVLGPELVTNGNFSNGSTGWALSAGMTVSGGLLIGNTTTNGLARQDIVAIGKTYRVELDLISYTSGTPYIGVGEVVTNISTELGHKVFTITATSSTVVGVYPGLFGVGGVSSYDNISVRELPGNHATQTTATKRPILKLIAGKYSLLFDGIDDALVTGSIDFTATDKMTVVAGVRKLSDAAFGSLLEFGNLALNLNVFGVSALSGTALATYRYRSTGSAVSDSVSAGSFASPITNVLTGISNISGDSSILRINGTQAATNTTDQGTGNYGNYPLYIGSRAGTSLPFNGHLYSLIVRGALSTADQITSVEAWVNNKTGAY